MHGSSLLSDGANGSALQRRSPDSPQKRVSFPQWVSLQMSARISLRRQMLLQLRSETWFPTMAAAFSFLVFNLLNSPCLAAISTMAQQMQSQKVVLVRDHFPERIRLLRSTDVLSVRSSYGRRFLRNRHSSSCCCSSRSPLYAVPSGSI